MGYDIKQPTTLCVDNQSALQVMKNPEHHGRMKHLDLRFYWLRDTVAAGHIHPVYLSTDLMPADILVKHGDISTTAMDISFSILFEFYFIFSLSLRLFFIICTGVFMLM